MFFANYDADKGTAFLPQVFGFFLDMKSSVRDSSGHFLVDLSIGRSFTLFISHLVGRLVGQLAGLLVNLLVCL